MKKVFRKKQNKKEETQDNKTAQRYNELLLRQERFSKKLNDEAWKLEKQRNFGRDYIR